MLRRHRHREMEDATAKLYSAFLEILGCRKESSSLQWCDTGTWGILTALF